MQKKNMSDSKFQKYKFKVHGTHCQSCELIIEEKFKTLSGVQSVHVNHATGKIKFIASREPGLSEMNALVEQDGYKISSLGQDEVAGQTSILKNDPEVDRKRHFMEIGAVLLIVLAVYSILKQFDLVPNTLGISDNMNYGVAFIIGLVAAFSSCIAVTGGMLLAVAGRYNENNPGLTGVQKFKPHIYFNIGRLISYAVLGGLVGLIGSAITLSSKVTGIVTIVVSIVMILLGLQLLKIFPWASKCTIRMPKFLGRRAHALGGPNAKTGPFLLGSATFFLPCGFTQALQLYVLSKGDFMDGTLIMLFFALGTLPALLSLSLVSSFAKGTFQRYFLKLAGVVVIMLGLFNINNGFNLTGLSLASILPSDDAQSGSIDSNVEIVDGKQIVEMKVEGLTYTPSRFKVVKDIPVEWRIDGGQAIGCAQVITVPALGMTEFLPPGKTKIIEFTPDSVGEIRFSCTMGMTSPDAAFVVVENESAPVGADSSVKPAASPPSTELASVDSCDPATTTCNVQRLNMEISNERGFYPNVFTVQTGVPVELEIDTKVQLGGCMGTMIIPDYNVAHVLSLGKTTVKFTPTETGVVPFMCSMGIQTGQFEVI